MVQQDLAVNAERQRVFVLPLFSAAQCAEIRAVESQFELDDPRGFAPVRQLLERKLRRLTHRDGRPVAGLVGLALWEHSRSNSIEHLDETPFGSYARYRVLANVGGSTLRAHFAKEVTAREVEPGAALFFPCGWQWKSCAAPGMLSVLTCTVCSLG